MKAIWTQDAAEYHGEFVNFDPMMSLAEAGAEAVSADPGRRRVPLLARGAPSVTATAGCRRSPRMSPTPLTELIPRFRQMAAEAGRDPGFVHISIGGQRPDIDLIKRYQDPA